MNGISVNLLASIHKMIHGRIFKHVLQKGMAFLNETVSSSDIKIITKLMILKVADVRKIKKHKKIIYA